MKKHHYTVMSTRKCVACGKPLKQNLIDKNPDATLCYKHNRVIKGKPQHHVPRRKRIEAGLPVHHLKSLF